MYRHMHTKTTSDDDADDDKIESGFRTTYCFDSNHSIVEHRNGHSAAERLKENLQLQLVFREKIEKKKKSSFRPSRRCIQNSIRFSAQEWYSRRMADEPENILYFCCIIWQPITWINQYTIPVRLIRYFSSNKNERILSPIQTKTMQRMCLTTSDCVCTIKHHRFGRVRLLHCCIILFINS